MKSTFPILLFLLFSSALSAQNPVIVLASDAPAPDRRAAEVLQFYLGKMTGQPVPIQPEKPGEQSSPLFVGQHEAASSYGLQAQPRPGIPATAIPAGFLRMKWW
jgi:hypothetical protein